jgi:hypothetical protein
MGSAITILGLVDTRVSDPAGMYFTPVAHGQLAFENATKRLSSLSTT